MYKKPSLTFKLTLTIRQRAIGHLCSVQNETYVFPVKAQESPKPEPVAKLPVAEENGNGEDDILLANRLRLAQKMGGPRKKADKQ